MSDSGRLEFLTVGHSTHSIEKFNELIEMHAVEVVADVRSAPYSRFTPHFNREAFREQLRGRSVRYVFLGRELGARSSDRTHYSEGRVVYSRIAESAHFKDGIARLIAGARQFRIALVCAEKDPIDCHRAVLVGRELEKTGAIVHHIHATGAIERSEDFLARVFSTTGVPWSDMFRGRPELEEEAFRKQGQKVAYTPEFGLE